MAWFMGKDTALTDALLWDILQERLPAAAVNELVWAYLGYEYDPVQQTWRTERVAAPWRERFPTPPDFIQDRAAIVHLTRSIPPADKQLLKAELGFPGYRVDELTPERTRRATIVNWLLHIRRQHP
ncbi:DUF1823 family protein [Gloeomargarita sp.]